MVYAYCHRCNTALPDTANFCTACGAQVNQQALGNQQNSMPPQKKKVPVWLIIIAGILVFIVATGAFFLLLRDDGDSDNDGKNSNISEDIEEDDDESEIYEGPLVGTWHQAQYGEHGNAQYLWSFGENGHFAFLFSAREPPQGGGDIEGSVREYFIKGKFRINGNSIECYDVKYDDYLAWGDEWKYFPDRNPETLAGLLLETPFKGPDKLDAFSMDFEFDESMTLRLVIDLGDFPNQYDMDFTQIR